MLQFHIELCRIENNVAHKVQHQSSCSIGACHAWLASDVEGFILTGTHVDSTNNEPGGPQQRIVVMERAA